MTLLHVTIAADVFRDAGNGHGLRQLGRRQFRQQAAHRRAVFKNQRALRLALGRMAEHVERRAAQAFQLGQHAERLQHPRAIFLLDQMALRIRFCHDRWRQVELELDVALEHGGDLRLEGAVRVQARHFVLVLVRHQLVEVAGHGFRQAQVRAIQGAFGRAHLADEVQVLLRIRAILVGRQQGDSFFDDVVERVDALEFHHLGGGCHAHQAGRIVGAGAAPVEGGLVERHRDVVQVDGRHDRRLGERHLALLPGIAEHEHVRRDGVAHQRRGDLARVDEIDVIRAAGLFDFHARRSTGELPVRVFHKGGRRRAGRVDHGPAASFSHARQGVAAGRDDQIATDHQVGRTGADAGRVDILLAVRQAHVRHHGAALLRQAAHVEHGTALAFHVRRHGQDLADGDHARAANAGDQNAERLGRRRNARRRQGRRGWCVLVGACRFFRLFQAAAFHRHEAGAETRRAREILVAGRLVDLALAPQFRFQRFHRQAVRLHGTVAAAFADGFVDDGALGRVRVFIAFPAAAFFRGTGLIVDHGRHAGHVAQFALHVHQFRTVAHGHAFGPGVIVRILFRLIGDDDDGTDAFGGDLARNDGRR